MANWVQRFLTAIQTHKDDVSAHHTKYTDGEAIAAAKTDSALENPSGMIIMWHGTIATIPSGWVICDGNNSTPNLLTRFVQGVATAATDPGATGGATSKTTAGHTHTNPATGGGSAHTHSLPYDSEARRAATQAGWYTVETTGKDASGSESAHTHTQGSTGSKTDSIADIRPLFYDIAFLMKT